MLKQQLQADIKEAMKQKDQELVGVLRMAVAAINAKQAEKRYALAKADPSKSEEALLQESQLSEEDALGVIISEVKKRRDAIALYEQGGRPELAETEKKEIAMLQKYLPQQLSVDELKKLVQASIEKTGAKEIKDMGRIMADLMPQVKGKAEGSEISKIIKELLAK